MAIADRQLADVRQVVGPMARAAMALNNDDALAERLIHAVHENDSAEVSRALTDAGATNVAHRRSPSLEPVRKGRTREALEFSPNERWHCIFIFEFDSGK